MLVADLQDKPVWDAAIAAQEATAESADTGDSGGLLALGGMMTMDDAEGDGDGFSPDSQQPCTITNDAASFQIVSTVMGTNGYGIVFQSCSDHAYLIESASALSATTAWSYVAAIVPGLDGTTPWIDASTVNTNIPARFYRVDRWWLGDSIGDGIPDWWRQFYFGSGTTTNSFTCASCSYIGDGVSNLEKYLEGRDPTKTAVADTSGLVGLDVFTPTE